MKAPDGECRDGSSRPPKIDGRRFRSRFSPSKKDAVRSGGYTSFSYDRTGRRIAVQAPLVTAGSAITSMAYEPRGLMTTLTYADLSQELFSYDAAGRQTVHVLPDGSRVSRVYDNMARLLQIIPPAGQNPVSQAWDARSRRVLMMDRSGNFAVQYYVDGRVQSAQASAGLVTYSYDAGGRRTGMTYAAGNTQYGYDQDNNLTSVQNPLGESTGYACDLAERLNTITLANGSIVSMRYDNANRLVYIGDNSTTGLGFAYALDANGNRVTITENDGSKVNNTYDAKNRLTLEARTGTTPYSNGYSYDLNDNLTSVRGTSYSVDIMGKITNAGFVYDTNGRLTARPGTDGTTHLSYDYAGRVTSLTLASGFTIVYGLDGDGTLRSETRGGKRYDLVRDGKDALRESNITVTLTPSGGSVALRPRDLVRLPGATAAYTRDITDYTYGLGLLSQRTTVSRFFRWDGIGTLRNLEDSSKNIVASSVFDAYGLQQNAVTLASAYGFVGEQGVRGEKGLAPGTLVPQNMRARMYDPLTGRFTSRDPIWDKNLYQYGNSNPRSFTDASGMQATTSGTWLPPAELGRDPWSFHAEISSGPPIDPLRVPVGRRPQPAHHGTRGHRITRPAPMQRAKRNTATQPRHLTPPAVHPRTPRVLTLPPAEIADIRRYEKPPVDRGWSSGLFRADNWGDYIISHWLHGHGKPVVLRDDDRVANPIGTSVTIGEYMRANRYLENQANEELKARVNELLKGRDARVGSKWYVMGSFHGEMDPDPGFAAGTAGFDNRGFVQLFGSKETVGDVRYYGTIRFLGPHVRGGGESFEIDMNWQWNDIIDPNPAHMDQVPAMIATIMDVELFGDIPANYRIAINWHSRAIISFGGKEHGWPILVPGAPPLFGH